MTFLPHAWEAGLLLLLVLLSACRTVQRNAPLFEDVSKESALDFWHYSGATGELNLPEINGSGAALFDYDGDGDLDLYLVQGAPALPGPGAPKPTVPVPPDWKPGNRLFRNNLIPSGKLSFTDVTDEAGVGYKGIGMGVAVGDYDNDGHIDMYVTNLGRNVLYHNNGNGTFTDVTGAAGVSSSGWSSSAAFIDYDRDGWLDLVVVHYVEFYPRACYEPEGRRDYCGPVDFEPTVTQVFHNLGNGKFQDVTSTVGLDAKRGPGLGILTGDFNSDGWPDFIVTNDGAANHLWLNQPRNEKDSHDRAFQESGLAHGVAYAADGRARAGMGVAAGDVDGAGRIDVVVTNLPSEGFTLFRQLPVGDFMDYTVQAGVLNPSTPHTGFGVGFLDMENRGLLDLFSANGAVKYVQAQRGDPFPYHERNLLMRNLGKGKGFEDVTDRAGPAFQRMEVGRAAAFGDVNNDGGTDILVTNNNGPARLLLNAVPERGHWIILRLEGVRSNRSAYGSVVELTRKDGTFLRSWVRADGSYLSANDSRVHFGLGKSTEAVQIKVRWPSGGCEDWRQIPADRITTVREGSGQVCSGR